MPSSPSKHTWFGSNQPTCKRTIFYHLNFYPHLEDEKSIKQKLCTWSSTVKQTFFFLAPSFLWASKAALFVWSKFLQWKGWFLREQWLGHPRCGIGVLGSDPTTCQGSRCQSWACRWIGGLPPVVCHPSAPVHDILAIHRYSLLFIVIHIIVIHRYSLLFIVIHIIVIHRYSYHRYLSLFISSLFTILLISVEENLLVPVGVALLNAEAVDGAVASVHHAKLLPSLS